MHAVMVCDDSSSCFMSKQKSVIFISIINFFGCVMDTLTSEEYYDEMHLLIKSARKIVGSLFLLANLMLLLASVSETALFIDIYLWYSLGYIAMWFPVTIYEFVVRLKLQGLQSLFVFLPEVILLFVSYQCLYIVDLYRRLLYSKA